jgi:hypothetical protein
MSQAVRDKKSLRSLTRSVRMSQRQAIYFNHKVVVTY